MYVPWDILLDVPCPVPLEFTLNIMARRMGRAMIIHVGRAGYVPWDVPYEFTQKSYGVSHLVQGPLMRLHGLGRVVVRVAGSQVALPDISKKDAARVMATLTA